ncbi:T9SS type A sorting domain-containing protein [bacterium]|nr:T9SS type A sorting domain-containing protein [bacterium]
MKLKLIIAIFISSVFTAQAQTFELSQEIQSANNDHLTLYGYRIVTSSDRCVISAPAEKFTQSGESFTGKLYYYKLDSSTNLWAEKGEIPCPVGGIESNFGLSMVMNDSLLIVGAPNYDETSSNVPDGRVYIFKLDQDLDQWSLFQTLHPNDSSDGFFGHSLSLYDKTLVIGSPGSNFHPNTSSSCDDCGSVSVWELDHTFMKKQVLTDLNLGHGELFGQSVSVYDSLLAIGIPRESYLPGNTNRINHAGAVLIFEQQNEEWKFKNFIRQDKRRENVAFGYEVNLGPMGLVVRNQFNKDTQDITLFTPFNNSFRSTFTTHSYGNSETAMASISQSDSLIAIGYPRFRKITQNQTQYGLVKIYKNVQDSIVQIDSIINPYPQSPSLAISHGFGSTLSFSNQDLFVGLRTFVDSFQGSVQHAKVQRYKPNNCTDIYDTLTITACDKFKSFDGTTITAPGIYDQVYITPGGCLGYVHFNLSFNYSSAAQIDTLMCGFYRSPSGRHTVSIDSILLDTIINANGCDSLLTIHVTSLNQEVGISFIAGSFRPEIEHRDEYTYQWVNCLDNYAPILGANQREFTPEYEGLYALSVTANGCSNISNCYYVEEQNLLRPPKLRILAYPMPNDGILYLDFGIKLRTASLEIYSSNGQLVSEHEFEELSKYKLALPESSGIYYGLLYTNSNKPRVFKIVRK